MMKINDSYDFKKWLKQEDDQLHILYNVDMLTVMEIFEKTRIYPWFIITRLCEQKYIKTEEDSRGYNVYKQSALYGKSSEYNEMTRRLSGIAGIAYSN